MKAIIIGHDLAMGMCEIISRSDSMRELTLEHDIPIVHTHPDHIDRVANNLPKDTEIIHIGIESNVEEEINKHLIETKERGIIIVGSNISPYPVTKRMAEIEPKLNPVIYSDFKSGKEARRERRAKQRKR